MYEIYSKILKKNMFWSMDIFYSSDKILVVGKLVFKEKTYNFFSKRSEQNYRVIMYKNLNYN